MAERYELWLDESGDFVNEKNKSTNNKKASLIGGILISAQNGEKAFNEITIPTNLSHATELTDEQKRNHVLPILKKLYEEYGAKQVFFENALYEEGKGNLPSKSLYLRMMAEGILQLLMTLDARQDDIHLDVFIAKRSVELSTNHTTEITTDEYYQYLKDLIDEKKKNRKIVFSSNTIINYKRDSAQASKKLQMADFACNSRLTRDSSAFASDEYKDLLSMLHKDAYIFYLNELNSTNYIKQCLIENRITDAVMEVLTTEDPIDTHETMLLITEKMSTVGFRILKSQMKDINACLIAYADKQDRYEEEEIFLNRIWEKIIPEFERCNYPCGHLKFNVLSILTEVYLKEGDIISARKTLEEMKKSQLLLGDCVEEIFSLFKVKEKEALLYIKELDYAKAKETMEGSCKLFRQFMEAISENNLINNRFDSPVSEYYGDALCMQLHAMMFMQRENPEIYEECCRVSDEAMKQYPKLPGELELHRKYRCHFEIEKGDLKKAVEMLALAKEYKLKDLSEESLSAFLKRVSLTEEDEGSVNYLMYYLLIICEAKRRGDDFAKTLENALFNGEDLLRATGIVEDRDPSFNRNVDIRRVINTKDKREYHPREIVNWKLGSIYLYDGKYDQAMRYLIAADTLCEKSKEYSLMRIVGIAVKAELIFCLIKKPGSKSQLNTYISSLKKTFEELSSQNLQPATREFVNKLQAAYDEAGINETIDSEKLLEISRMIPY